MRQLYCVLERMPGCKKGATSVERAGDVVYGGSSRDQRTERKRKTGDLSGKTSQQSATGILLGVALCGLSSGSGSRFKRGSRAEGALRSASSQGSEFEPSSVVCDQSLVLG